MFVEKYTIYEVKPNSDIFTGGNKLSNVHVKNSSGEICNITKQFDSKEHAQSVLNLSYILLDNGVYVILPIYIKE